MLRLTWPPVTSSHTRSAIGHMSMIELPDDLATVLATLTRPRSTQVVPLTSEVHDWAREGSGDAVDQLYAAHDHSAKLVN